MQANARNASEWARAMMGRFQSSTFVAASVVACQGTLFQAESREYNSWLHRSLSLGPRMGLLDRSSSSAPLPFDQTASDFRSRCTPFHAFGRVVVEDAVRAVTTLAWLRHRTTRRVLPVSDVWGGYWGQQCGGVTTRRAPGWSAGCPNAKPRAQQWRPHGALGRHPRPRRPA